MERKKYAKSEQQHQQRITQQKYWKNTIRFLYANETQPETCKRTTKNHKHKRTLLCRFGVWIYSYFTRTLVLRVSMYLIFVWLSTQRKAIFNNK